MQINFCRLSSSEAAAHFALVLSSPVLRLVDGIVVVNGGLLLYDLAPGARARHGGAEEDVDEEHDGEEHAERDAQPQQPLVRDAAEGRGAVNRARCNVQRLHSSSLISTMIDRRDSGLLVMGDSSNLESEF